VVALEALLFPFARDLLPVDVAAAVVHAGPNRPPSCPGAFYVGKAVMFVVRVSVAIPLGIVGFLYLGLTEHRGAGYRLS